MTNRHEAVANPLSRREVPGAGLGLGGSALAVTIGPARSACRQQST
jgi:hypothetical protein